MKEIEIWKYIDEKLKKNRKIYLLTIADSSNASPGRTGFKMAIADDKSTIGTIGGGIMEFDILKNVERLLNSENSESFFRKYRHGNSGDGENSGLICGGFQTIVYKFIDSSYLGTVGKIISSMENGENGLLKISAETLEFSKNKKAEKKLDFQISSEEWTLNENIGIPNRVYIVGGGHVGLAVSRIMSTLDFFITVFDHRKEVDTLSRNNFADKIVITPYIDIKNYIIEGEESYVVIVSPSHIGDKDALQSVLKLNLKYLGSMGSRKKINSLFSQLRKEGFTDEDLARIHTPIGLEIEAETVEEIAVSIASEIIAVKNGFIK